MCVCVCVGGGGGGGVDQGMNNITTIQPQPTAVDLTHTAKQYEGL